MKYKRICQYILPRRKTPPTLPRQFACGIFCFRCPFVDFCSLYSWWILCFVFVFVCHALFRSKAKGAAAVFIYMHTQFHPIAHTRAPLKLRTVSGMISAVATRHMPHATCGTRCASKASCFYSSCFPKRRRCHIGSVLFMCMYIAASSSFARLQWQVAICAKRKY